MSTNRESHNINVITSNAQDKTSIFAPIMWLIIQKHNEFKLDYLMLRAKGWRKLWHLYKSKRFCHC